MRAIARFVAGSFRQDYLDFRSYARRRWRKFKYRKLPFQPGEKAYVKSSVEYTDGYDTRCYVTIHAIAVNFRTGGDETNRRRVTWSDGTPATMDVDDLLTVAETERKYRRLDAP